MPLVARRSATGVRAMRPPLQPSASKRCWSVVMKRMLRPMRRSSGGARDEVDDHLGQLFAAVLLEEVSAALDGRVGLALRARDGLLKPAVAAPRDGILIAEGGEEGLSPASQHLPGTTGRDGRRVVGADGNERRELAGAGLVAVVGEGGVVRRDDVGREIRRTAALDDAADVELGRLLRELLPGEERLARLAVAGRQEGV